AWRAGAAATSGTCGRRRDGGWSLAGSCGSGPRGVEQGEGLADGRRVGRPAVLDLVADLLAERLERRAVGFVFRPEQDGRRRTLADLMEARRDRRGGILERDVADRLAADLHPGPLEGPGVDPRVVDLVH